MWLDSFKKFFGLPTNLQHVILEQIFTPTTLFSHRAHARAQGNIQYRFRGAKLDNSVDE
jgi:hypothetical protein